MRRAILASVLTVAVVGALAGGTAPAMAGKGSAELGVAYATKAAWENENSLSDTAVRVEPADSAEVYVSSANDVDIILPRDPEEPVTLHGTTESVEFTLPASTTADSLEVTNEGAVAYDNNDGSYTVPIPGEAGDLQVNTVIESPDAPSAYPYSFNLPEGFKVHEAGGGLVFLDSEGGLLLMLAKPWATDAAGSAVPTRYEVDGNVVTQVVEHNSNFAYPIVADPWMGVKLFTAFSTGKHLGQTKYNGWVTPQAVAVLGLGGGIVGIAVWNAVMRGAGWDEWKAKWSKITNKASLKQQFDCHVAGGIYGIPFTRDFNLERSRPDRKNGNWVDGVVFHLCNWAKSTGTAKNWA